MNPTRAAWFFVVGICWLVLRGIVGHSVPALRPDHLAASGGVWLLVPLLSVAASLTVPLFFVAFLRHHDFSGQRALRIATAAAAGASLLSLALVAVSFFSLVQGGLEAESTVVMLSSSAPWLVRAIPLLLVVSLLAFLIVFARECRCPKPLRRAAAVAAVGTSFPAVLMIGWQLHLRFPELLRWLPRLSEGVVARVLGLAGAAALVWFLESFAVTYGRPEQVTQRS